MSIDFFVINQETDEIETNGWLPEPVSHLVSNFLDERFDSELDTKEFDDYFSEYDRETCSQIWYSLKLGAFTKHSNGEYTLEDTFSTMREINDDMRNFSMSEYIDFVYRPYVLIEYREYEHQAQYDTLREKYL